LIYPKIISISQHQDKIIQGLQTIVTAGYFGDAVVDPSKVTSGMIRQTKPKL
jgi:hypothetical protein